MHSLLVFLAGLATASAPAAEAPPSQTPASRPSLDEAFTRLDANQDEKLDRQEFERFMQRSRSLSGSDAGQVFGKLDVDKDGALTAQEFKGVIRLGTGKSATPTPTPPTPATTPSATSTPKPPTRGSDTAPPKASATTEKHDP
ncbi:MAG: EF-hand domain-containing protein, partial [Verrucomicrobium sp.]